MRILYFDKKELFGDYGFKKLYNISLFMHKTYECEESTLIPLLKMTKETMIMRFDSVLDSTKVILLTSPLFLNEAENGFYLFSPDDNNTFIPWIPTVSQRWFSDVGMTVPDSCCDEIKIMDLNIMKLMYQKCTRSGYDSFTCIDPCDTLEKQLQTLNIYMNPTEGTHRYIIIYHEDPVTGTGLLFIFKPIPIIEDSAIYPMRLYTIDDLQHIYHSGLFYETGMPIESRFNFAYISDYIGNIPDEFCYNEIMSYWDSLIVPICRSSVIKGSLRL